MINKKKYSINKITVCMATYNGSKFVLEQVYSILDQLDYDDELIVLDDCSTDDTLDILSSVNDKRIKIHKNHNNIGCVATFEKLIEMADGEVIFLSDQDDIWPENRLVNMIDSLYQSRALLVSGNFMYINERGKQLSRQQKYRLTGLQSNDYVKNIIKIFLGRISYYGSAMAFRSVLKKHILPFPKKLENHDLWIAMIANMLKKNIHTSDLVLKRRQHCNNLSEVSRNFFLKIKTRLHMVQHCCLILVRILFR